MSQLRFKIGDNVHISEAGNRYDGQDGVINDIDPVDMQMPYRVETSSGYDWYEENKLTLNPPKPQRDAIPPQPTPKLPPVVREMETAAAKISGVIADGTAELKDVWEKYKAASLPVEEVETLPNGAKQSRLGHWWSTPYAALAVARVMSEGHAKYDEPGTTPAQGNWHGIPIWSNIQHALTHLMLYAIHDKSEDHLAHAATRLMMALDQRESGRQSE